MITFYLGKSKFKKKLCNIPLSGFGWIKVNYSNWISTEFPNSAAFFPSITLNTKVTVIKTWENKTFIPFVSE